MSNYLYMKVLFAVILSVLSLNLYASTKGETLVVVVNFDCPNCQRFSSFIKLLDSSLGNDGVPVVIAPIPYGEENNYRELFYYAVDQYNREWGRKVLDVAFKLSKEDVDIKSLEQFLDWMNIEYPEIKDWKEFLDPKILNLAKIRLGRAYDLARGSGMVYIPAFFKISGNKSKMLIEDGNIANKVTKIINKFRETE